MIFTIEASGDADYLVDIFNTLSPEQKQSISKYVEGETVEINSLEDLLDISRITGSRLILSIESWVNKNNEREEQPHIEIYNSFIE